MTVGEEKVRRTINITPSDLNRLESLKEVMPYEPSRQKLMDAAIKLGIDIMEKQAKQTL